MPEAQTEPKSRKVRRSRTKKVSEEEAEKLIAKAKEEARKKKEIIDQSDFADEAEGEIPMTDLFDTAEDTESAGLFGAYHEEPGSAEEIQRENAIDVFDYVEEHFVPNGTPIKFRVKRNGQFLGEHDYPLTWTDIQKTYGGGHFTVEARNATNNRYLKQQTQLIYAPTKSEESKPRNEGPAYIPPPQQPQFDPNEMMKGLMGAFQRMNEMTWEERQKKERDERKNDSQFNTTFLTLMQNQQQSTQNMFLEMQKTTQETLKAVSENFSKSQERMDDKFTKMFEKLSDNSKGKDEFSLKDMLMLQQQAEDRGWDKMKMLLELSEMKAEERLSSKDDDDDSGSGIIGPLVKGILPLLSGASQQQQMLLQQQQQRIAAQQRGSLPASQGTAPAAQPPQGHRAGPPKSQNRPDQAKATARSEEVFKENPLGLPTFADERKEARVKAPKVDLVSEVREAKPVNEPAQEGPKTIDDLYGSASQTQQAIANIAIPIIAETIFNDAIQPKSVADLCIEECAKRGIDRATVLREFTFDFMLQVAGAFGIGEEKRPWFEDFYANIQDETGMDVEGEDEPTLG